MKKILIVVDMQHDFIDGSLGSEEALNRVLPNVIKKIKQNRKNNEILLFTRDTHPQSYSDTFEGKHLPVKHCVKNTVGWQIHKDIMNLPVSYETNCLIIDKSTFGSLAKTKSKQTDLRKAIEQYVNKDEEFEIEICGLCTDICVISNALILRAAWPDVTITVDSKATAGTDKQSYEAALKVMQKCQIDVLS